jgi:hypothetical protein
MTVQNLYTQYLDGKVTKAKFLYEVRRDQNLTMVSHHNNFDDTVKILKNKNIISEKASKESTGKQEVDVIAKTIDMVNPYEYSRGMKYELEVLDTPTISADLSEDNVLKAQKKVLSNLTKNPQFYFDKIYGRDNKVISDKWIETTKKNIDAIGKGKAAKSLMRENKESQEKLVKDSKTNKIVGLHTTKDGFVPNAHGKILGYKASASIPKGTKFGGTKIDENYTPSTMNQKQEAVLQMYAESTGIPIDNLRSMIRDAKESKLAKKDYDNNDKIESPEKEYKGSRNKAIKGVKEHGQYFDRVSDVNADSSPIGEDLDQHYTQDDIKPYSDGQNYTDITDIENLTREQLTVLRQIVQDFGLTEYDLEDPAVLSDVEEELSIRMKAVTSTDQSVINPSEPMNEDCGGCERKTNDDLDLGHQDNEPHMVKGELYQIAKQASELYKIIDSVDNMGEVDFPHWWQAKVILAKNYLEGAKDYLESALATGNEDEEMEEAITAKTNDSTHNTDAIKQINKIPNTTARAELTKAFNSGKTVDL